MESETSNSSEGMTELYVDQLILKNSFEKHLTSIGDNVKTLRQAKIEKYSHKALKSIENLINELPDDSSRLEFLFTRYAELFQDLSLTQFDLRCDKTELKTLRRAIEEIRTNDLRNAEARKRLEVTCNDLQIQNKNLKEETLSLHKEEEKRRLQVVNKFQKTLAEVSSIVQDNVKKNTKLQRDKLNILNQLTLADKSCQQREKQVQCLEKQLLLQENLGKAGVLQVKVEVDDLKIEWAKDRDKWQEKDKQNKEVRLEDKAKINTMQIIIDGYIDKVEALEYSNRISKEKTEKYKEHLCSTQRDNIILLKKVKIYKDRFTAFDKKNMELKQLIKSKESKVKDLLKRTDKLEKICKKLQLDRALFLKLLQENNIETAEDETNLDTELQN